MHKFHLEVLASFSTKGSHRLGRNGDMICTLQIGASKEYKRRKKTKEKEKEREGKNEGVVAEAIGKLGCAESLGKKKFSTISTWKATRLLGDLTTATLTSEAAEVSRGRGAFFFDDDDAVPGLHD
jgi:hypothetical protein